VLLQDEEQLG